MGKKKIESNWSDAWLLLAIIYAGDEGANLERIIEVGDGIEHAIFNPDELESGLARLTSSGYIKEKNGVFFATPKVMSSYLKTTSQRAYIHKDLERIEKLIGAASATSAQPHSNNLKYAGFSTAAYTDAVNRYLERMARQIAKQ
jgi:hypothetical protein